MTTKQKLIRNTNGTFSKKTIELVEAPSPGSYKSAYREAIAEEVFDLEDSVADNAKWLSLLTTLMSRMYNAMPEEQKATMSDADRSLIEYMFEQFASTNTRADVKVASEGAIKTIDDLMENQKKVGDIVK